MTTEYSSFERDLDAAFFNYAHLTGAVELYIQVLETPALQRAFSKTISGQEIEWKMIHRFMSLANQTVVWYPELPVGTILQQKNTIIGLLYGIFLSRMIGLVDYYFSSVLKSRFCHTEKSGSSWDAFSQKAKIDLLVRKNGAQVYSLLQERHKIEHNKAQIDQTFVDRMLKKGVTHSYAAGDSIQKSHLDVLAARDAIKEFVADVDSLMT
ncbi:MAG: hypothetical protein Q7S40_29340 [Opitutaceae bacterium]|nr:hypothetical protein [Opitutaceae bacterium]